MSILNSQSNTHPTPSLFLGPSNSTFFPSISLSLQIDSGGLQNAEPRESSLQSHVNVDLNSDQRDSQLIPNLPSLFSDNAYCQMDNRLNLNCPSSLSPNKDLDPKVVRQAFNPNNQLQGGIQENLLSPFKGVSQYQRASPFLPFCRDHLSPLCALDSHFTSMTSKRVLFSPKYIIPIII
jgi:hypothetical protein